MLLPVYEGSEPGGSAQTTSCNQSLASFTQKGRFSKFLLLWRDEVKLLRGQAVFLTLLLCCFHINIFTGTFFWQPRLALRTVERGKVCSPHANGMHLSQLRARVIWYQILFAFVLMLSHWLSVCPLSLSSNRKQLGWSQVHVQILYPLPFECSYPLLWPRK